MRPLTPPVPLASAKAARMPWRMPVTSAAAGPSGGAAWPKTILPEATPGSASAGRPATPTASPARPSLSALRRLRFRIVEIFPICWIGGRGRHAGGPVGLAGTAVPTAAGRRTPLRRAFRAGLAIRSGCPARGRDRPRLQDRSARVAIPPQPDAPPASLRLAEIVRKTSRTGEAWPAGAAAPCPATVAAAGHGMAVPARPGRSAP